MPVVINEFEVVPEPATPVAQPMDIEPAPRRQPDIEVVLAELHGRRRRVRAY